LDIKAASSRVTFLAPEDVLTDLLTRLLGLVGALNLGDVFTDLLWYSHTSIPGDRLTFCLLNVLTYSSWLISAFLFGNLTTVTSWNITTGFFRDQLAFLLSNLTTLSLWNILAFFSRKWRTDLFRHVATLSLGNQLTLPVRNSLANILLHVFADLLGHKLTFIPLDWVASLYWDCDAPVFHSGTFFPIGDLSLDLFTGFLGYIGAHLLRLLGPAFFVSDGATGLLRDRPTVPSAVVVVAVDRNSKSVVVDFPTYVTRSSSIVVDFQSHVTRSSSIVVDFQSHVTRSSSIVVDSTSHVTRSSPVVVNSTSYVARSFPVVVDSTSYVTRISQLVLGLENPTRDVQLSLGSHKVDDVVIADCLVVDGAAL